MGVTARRASDNPILTPSMIPASSSELEVVGVFNPAVARHEGEIVLLLRVAEAARCTADEVAAPIFDPASRRLEVKRWPRDAKGLDASDPRMIVAGRDTWLSSISHLRVARSNDGVHFRVDAEPALAASNEYERFGVEDARITPFGGKYWVNYTAVSPHGIATALASTSDFKTFERHGIIFPPPNRDVTIFPEQVGGRYVALHRPMPSVLGRPAIWLASSADLLSWGDHRLVAAAREGRWDDEKVGGGAVPFRVRAGKVDGWLAIYHGVTRFPPTYSLGALLLDSGDPSRVIARSRKPILRPEAPYEREGFFGGVVFTCGALVEGDCVRIYYGAADGVTALAELSLAEILDGLSSP